MKRFNRFLSAVISLTIFLSCCHVYAEENDEFEVVAEEGIKAVVVNETLKTEEETEELEEPKTEERTEKLEKPKTEEETEELEKPKTEEETEELEESKTEEETEELEESKTEEESEELEESKTEEETEELQESLEQLLDSDTLPSSFNVVYEVTGIPAGFTYVAPETKSYMVGEEVTVAPVPNVLPIGYEFIGWKFVGTADAIGTFEMPDSEVIIQGEFRQLEYCVFANWDYSDGEYFLGTPSWDSKNLKYTYNIEEGGWSKSKVPYVKCTITNYGSKVVYLDFTADIDLWDDFLINNPFENIETVALQGSGNSYTFEFRSDEELIWDYEKLTNATLNNATSQTYTNRFKLSITK